MTVWNAPILPKRMELLRELVPSASNIGLLTNPTSSPVTEDETRYAQEAARTLGLQLHVLTVSTESEIDAALGTLDAGEARSWLVATCSISSVGNSSLPWRHSTRFRRSTIGASSPWLAG